jgi:hypothetical protein
MVDRALRRSMAAKSQCLNNRATERTIHLAGIARRSARST